jgi:hypothetical protein
MADVFSIIERRMRCQSEFHRQMAVVLADLDIGNRLDLHKFEKGG